MMTAALLCLCALAADPAPDAAFEDFFRDFAAKRDGIVALEAVFEQRTVLPDEELTTTGTLVYIKPRRIIFRTEDPERTTLVDDRKGYEYDPEIRQLQIFDIEDNPQADIFFLGFDSDTALLRQAYDVSVFTVPGETHGKHGIKIRPKSDSREEAYFFEVNLYLRDEDYLPYRIHIQNDEESQVFIEVGALDKTVRPDPRGTQIFIAENTKVVENDRVVETVNTGGKWIPEAVLLPPAPETPPETATAPPPLVPAADAPAKTSAADTPAEAAPETAPAGKEPPPAKEEAAPRRNPKRVGGPGAGGNAGSRR